MKIYKITNYVVDYWKRAYYETYCNELAKSEYAIVPYDMDVYGTATSGVVREALYMGVKVIAPIKLLDNMGIYLPGYDRIENSYLFVFNKNVEVVKEEELLCFSKNYIIKEVKKILESVVYTIWALLLGWGHI